MSITAAGGGTNEYVSTMSTHPQWERCGSSELQNAYAQKCGRTLYAVGNISQLFPLSRKFTRIVSDIFVSQAIVHMQNSTITKLDTSQNLTSFLSIKLPTRQNFQLDLSLRFRRTFRVLVALWIFSFYPFLSSCRATDVATGRACHDPKGIAR